MAVIFGNSLANTLTGFATDDTIFGLAGNDVLYGAGGADVLYGGADEDVLYGGAGGDVLYGDAGNDLIVQNDDGAANTIYGGTGFDHLDLSGSSSGWNFNFTSNTGTSGATSAIATSIETLTASNFNDIITADADLSIIYGGDGNDTFINTAGSASIYAGNGNDTIEMSGTGVQELSFGSVGNDTFRYDVPGGDYSADFIFGGTGGQDRVLVVGNGDNQVFDLNGLEVSNIEEVEFGAIGGNRDITIILDPDEFNSTGAEYANNLLIDGNNVAESTEILRVDLNDSSTETFLDFSGWTFIGWGTQNEYVEIIGSARSETITGTSMSDSIDGGAGNDTITDIGGGLDVTLLGGTGFDSLDLSGSTAGWTIDTTNGGNNASSGTAIGRVDEFETITASNFNDIITADLDLSIIYGGDGNDTFINTAGSASIYAGNGNDTIEMSGTGVQELSFGSVGNDTFRYDVPGGDYSADFIFGGTGGQDRVLVVGNGDNQVFDLNGLEVSNIEEVEFGAIGGFRDITIILDPDEFNSTGAEYANNLLIDGNNVAESTEILRVDLNDSSTETFLDFSGWTFIGWGTQNEYVEIIGSARSETITGTSMSDSIDGGAGNDTITDIGGGLDVTLLGGTGFDSLDLSGSTAGWTIDTTNGGNNASSGTAIGRVDEFETITASNFNDIITADLDLSIIYGGDGNDTFINTAGSASIYAGNGNDTIEMSGTGVQELSFGSVGNDTFRYDVPGGDYSADFIFGGTGGQDRVLVVGNGDNQVFDLNGLEVSNIEEVEFGAIGGFRDITIILDPDEFNSTGAEYANNLLIDGNNVAESTEILRVDLNDSSTETFLDFSGWTFIGWGTQNEYVEIIGSARSETITGTSMSDSIDGGAGNDTITDIGGGLDVTLLGGTGFDSLDLSGSTAGWTIDTTNGGNNASSGTAIGRVDEFETITASNFNDIITADLDLSIIYGGDGNDTFINTAGSASIYAGNGNDTIEMSGTGVQELSFGSVGNDTFRYDVPGGDYSADFIFGGTGGQDRVLVVGNGDNQVFDLNGLEVSNIEEVEFGAIGGFRDITIILDPDEFNSTGAEYANNLLIDGNNVAESTEILRVDLNDSSTETFLDFSGWTFIGWGTQGERVEIIGSGRSETITGTSEVDSITGGAGNDTIDGQGGNDTIEGGAGNDDLDGGSGNDTLSYENSSAGVVVDLATNSASGGHADGDTIANFVHLTGSGHGDSLTGSTGDNSINGLGGNDTIESGAGADMIYGGIGEDSIDSGSGADIVYGGDGNDILDNRGNSGAAGEVLYGGADDDLVHFSELGSETAYGGSGNDTIDSSAFNGAYNLNLTTGVTNFTERAFEFENAITGNGNDLIVGTSGANTINSGGGNDTIQGEAGADVIFGGADQDIIYGGSENDTIEGGAGADVIYGGIGEDSIDSGSAADVVYGGDGNDILDNRGNSGAAGEVLYGGADDDLVHFSEFGSETAYGGSGIDTIDSSAFNGAYNLNLTTGVTNFAERAFEFENAITGNGNDLIVGTSGANTINSGGGNDTIQGEAGADVIFGGADTDIIYGGSENDTIQGGAGADVIYGGADNDTLFGGASGDTLNGDNGIDTASYQDASAGVYADLLVPANGTGDALGDQFISIENLTGSAFNDNLLGDNNINVLEGGVGNDGLYGRGGNDTLIGGAGGDILNGGNGIDIASYQDASAGVYADLLVFANGAGDALGDQFILIENLTGSAFNDNLLGDNNINVLEGGAGSDGLYGRGGNDTLFGGAGGDILNGGNGIDTASYQGASAGVYADLLVLPNGAGDALGDQFISIENLTGSAFNDNLLGDNNINVLEGGAGSDGLYGRGGNDTLIGGAGGDILNGGNGIDTASYQGASAGVYADLLVPANGTGDALGDQFILIENLTGSGFDDNLLGDNGVNVLEGGAGSDSLYGRDGNDTILGGVGADVIFGGADNDTLFGGAGGDTLNGDSGIDTASYQGASAGVYADLLVFANGAGDALGDQFISIENLTGSAFNDNLLGDNNINVLEGGVGSDGLWGRGGNDTLIGGAGGDILNGGNGIDTASYQGASAGVYADLLVFANGAGDALGDQFISIENLTGSAFNDNLLGDNGVNVLEGGAGSDGLYGRGGNDILIGGAGGDILNGGSGIDTASYQGASAGVYADLLVPANGTGDALGDQFIFIENLTGSNFGDNLLGDNNINVLEGGAGSDALYGRGGNDILIGGAGGDILNGGSGTDNASYLGTNSTDYTIVNVVGTRWEVTEIASGDVDTLIDIEVLVFDDMNMFI